MPLALEEMRYWVENIFTKAGIAVAIDGSEDDADQY